MVIDVVLDYFSPLSYKITPTSQAFIAFEYIAVLFIPLLKRYKKWSSVRGLILWFKETHKCHTFHSCRESRPRLLATENKVSRDSYTKSCCFAILLENERDEMLKANWQCTLSFQAKGNVSDLTYLSVLDIFTLDMILDINYPFLKKALLNVDDCNPATLLFVKEPTI